MGEGGRGDDASPEPEEEMQIVYDPESLTLSSFHPFDSDVCISTLGHIVMLAPTQEC